MHYEIIIMPSYARFVHSSIADFWQQLIKFSLSKLSQKLSEVSDPIPDRPSFLSA
jgi:hypothetical protein